jgi:DNA-binding sugar fermentation-stimulating protein
VRARFSATVQTSPGAHPASYTMQTGAFPGVKRQGRSVDLPPSSSAEVKERVDYTANPPLGLRGLF